MASLVAVGRFGFLQRNWGCLIMAAALLSVLSLLISVALLQLANGLYLTFISVRMDLEQFSELAIGAIGSAYFGGFIIGALYCDRFIQKVGHIRAYIGFGALTCAVVMSHSWLIDPVYWGLLRFIAGVVSSGLFMVVESWLNERSDRNNRGSIFAAYLVINYLALGGGQFLLNVSDPAGPMLFLLIGTLFALSLTPIALGEATVPAAYERRSFNVRELFDVSPLGVVGVLVIGLANGAFYSLAPIFAARLGFDTAGIGEFMAAAILSGLIMQWPLGKMSDLFDRRTILIIVAVLTCAVAAGIAAVTFNPEADHRIILILICAYGSALYALYPLAVAHANDHVEPADTVPLAAGLLLAYGVGALFGPFLASAVMGLMGTPGLFTFIAGVAGALAIFGLFRMRMSKPVPMDDQGTFMPLPRTSPVLVAEMHAMTDFEDAEFENNADEEPESEAHSVTKG